MKLIVGLGNPGKDYVHTRHNVGFETLDRLSEDLGIPINKVKDQGLYGQGNYQGEKIFLLKPQTYMNASGRAVGQFVSYFKIDIEDVLVLVDDIDIAFGEVRIKSKGSAGTHNGMKSIISSLGSQDFPRIKIGVGKKHPGEDLAKFILARFSKEDQVLIDKTMDRAKDACLDILKNGISHSMNHYNGKIDELKS